MLLNENNGKRVVLGTVVMIANALIGCGLIFLGVTVDQGIYTFLGVLMLCAAGYMAWTTGEWFFEWNTKRRQGTWR